ncbi:hypothetical protein VKT23_009685 [Stygiomarasmius scandens]|uniref:Uncharacterized protein n=1 Tax=Marasmiellus scandens TaxID=2682957 RepID=A0ABR1JGF0_9AGAR
MSMDIQELSYKRQTRSGATFSSWQRPFEVLKPALSFDLKEAMLRGVHLQQAADALNSAGNSPSAFDQALPLPIDCSPQPSSSTASEDAACQSPVSQATKKQKKTRRSTKVNHDISPQDSTPTPSVPAQSPENLQLPDSSSPKKSTRHGHEHRAKNRTQNQDPTTYQVRPAVLSRVLEEVSVVPVEEKVLEFAGNSSGYIGKDECDGSRATYSLDSVLKMGLELYRWDASFSAAVVDSNERIFSALIEKPAVNDWQVVQQQAAEALEAARDKLELSEEQKDHRRGHYPAMSYGKSMGGGQKVRG